MGSVRKLGLGSYGMHGNLMFNLTLLLPHIRYQTTQYTCTVPATLSSDSEGGEGGWASFHCIHMVRQHSLRYLLKNLFPVFEASPNNEKYKNKSWIRYEYARIFLGDHLCQCQLKKYKNQHFRDLFQSSGLTWSFTKARGRLVYITTYGHSPHRPPNEGHCQCWFLM
jgi:hypothetical protein